MEKWTQYFQEKTRINSAERFVCLTDNRPEKLQDLIREIHFSYFDGCLPNDWIYRTVFDAFEALENDTLDNCNIEADTYPYELLSWLNNSFATGMCNEYLQLYQDQGVRIRTLEELIQCVQVDAMRLIYIAVDRFIELDS